MRKVGDVHGVELEKVGSGDDSVRYAVIVGGRNVGFVDFMQYYEPVLKIIEPYVALWAGPTLCVIHRAHGPMRCVERSDETHEIHALERLWVIEGELNVDLFDPRTEQILATYYHTEVITNSTLIDGLIRIRDFAGTVVTLDPRRSLQVCDE